MLPARVVSRIDLALKLFLWSRRCFSRSDHALQITAGDPILLVKPVAVPVAVRLLELILKPVADVVLAVMVVTCGTTSR